MEDLHPLEVPEWKKEVAIRVSAGCPSIHVEIFKNPVTCKGTEDTTALQR